jgi:hypothetical protein
MREQEGEYKILLTKHRCAIKNGEKRMSEFSFHLEVLIKISHTEDTAPTSQKFIMNRETYCRISYQCNSLRDKNIDLIH